MSSGPIKRYQIVKEEESYDAPPLDFSFKSIKDLKGNLLTSNKPNEFQIFSMKSPEKVKESQ